MPNHEYIAAKAALQELAGAFQNIETMATIFQARLERVVDGIEADELVMELGRILDKHQEVMSEM